MQDFFIVMVLLAFISTISCAICFVVRWIKRKPKKNFGIFALVAFVLIWVFGFSAVAVSCRGEYIEVSRTEPTCATPGEIVYRCTECGKTKSEKVEPTGHTLVEISRIEPTAYSEGELVERCSICGETITTALEKLTNTGTDENADIPIGSSGSPGIVGDTLAGLMPAIESDGFAEKLLSFGFTDEEAADGSKILRQCGIPTIDSCEPTDATATIDGVVSFRGKLDDDRTILFTVDSRKIFYISLNGEDLYDADKGGYLKNFSDVHIPEKDITVLVADTLRSKTESTLDRYFTDTRYYDAWGYAREDNSYMVQCQASDGSILTDNWCYCIAWYECQESGDFALTGVQINGIQYAVK